MRLALLLAALFLAALPARAEIRATYVDKTYAISGNTGKDLYLSIGQRGPKVGVARAIALTTFDLKWGRDYQRAGNDCVLAAARPFLTITTTVPRPDRALPPAVERRWRAFIAGIQAHESVHARYIEEMAAEIHAATVGFRQPNDPGCTAIRKAIETPLKEIYARYRSRNAGFETSEMGDGGPVRALILDLVR